MNYESIDVVAYYFGKYISIEDIFKMANARKVEQMVYTGSGNSHRGDQ